MIELMLIGLLGGTLTTGSQVWQAYKTFKTKSTGDISARCILSLFAGTIVWCVYGLLISDLPVILFNGISVLVVGYIAVYKFEIIKTKME